MYLVSIEQEDSSWFEDPEAFDSFSEAEEFAESQKQRFSNMIWKINPKIEIVIYECQFRKRIEI